MFLIISRIEKILAIAAALILFGIMSLGLFDVTGRYIFGVPIPGATEIAEVWLAILIFCTLPIVTAKKGHVTVDLIPFNPTHFRGKLRMAISNFISFVVMIFMTWQIAMRAIEFASYGDRTSFLKIPLSPIAWFMSIMAFLSAMILLVHTFTTIIPPKNEKQEPIK